MKLLIIKMPLALASGLETADINVTIHSFSGMTEVCTFKLGQFLNGLNFSLTLKENELMTSRDSALSLSPMRWKSQPANLLKCLTNIFFSNGIVDRKNGIVCLACNINHFI